MSASRFGPPVLIPRGEQTSMAVSPDQAARGRDAIQTESSFFLRKSLRMRSTTDEVERGDRVTRNTCCCDNAAMRRSQRYGADLADQLENSRSARDPAEGPQAVTTWKGCKGLQPGAIHGPQ